MFPIVMDSTRESTTRNSLFLTVVNSELQTIDGACCGTVMLFVYVVGNIYVP